jgi:anti-repressor protein
MNELLKLDGNGNQAVSARELHVKLEIETPFRLWFPRMCEYGFVEGEDYTPYKFVHPQNQQETTDYILALGMTKEIAMIQRTDQGRAIRQYLIKVEEAWNTPELIAARALKWADSQLKIKDTRIAALEQRAAEDAPKVRAWERCLDAEGYLDFQQTAAVLNIKGLGRNNLFGLLRQEGVLSRRNIPYRNYIEMGCFRVIETTGYDEWGEEHINTKTLVHQKGIEFILRIISKKRPETVTAAAGAEEVLF